MNTMQVLTLSFIVFMGGAVRAETHYVWMDSPDSTPPFTTWSTAAHTIQKAVDVCSDGDGVWVTNGIYALHQQISITNRRCG